MCYKLRYSSLLFLKKNNNFIYIKGPLGKNTIKVPSNILFIIDNSKKIIIFYLTKSRNKKKKNLLGFISIFSNSCRTLIFGDLIGLNIEGLGLKFLNISINKNEDKILSMNLGYSDLVSYCIDSNCSLFFFKDNRNIFLYSTDFSYIRNQVFMLIGLKKSDKYKKKGFSLITKF